MAVNLEICYFCLVSKYCAQFVFQLLELSFVLDVSSTREFKQKHFSFVHVVFWNEFQVRVHVSPQVSLHEVSFIHRFVLCMAMKKDESWEFVGEATDEKSAEQQSRQGGAKARGIVVVGDMQKHSLPSALRRSSSVQGSNEADVRSQVIDQQQNQNDPMVKAGQMLEGKWQRVLSPGSALYIYGASRCVHVDCHVLKHRQKCIHDGSTDPTAVKEYRSCECLKALCEGDTLAADAADVIHEGYGCPRFAKHIMPSRTSKLRICCHCMRHAPTSK